MKQEQPHQLHPDQLRSSLGFLTNLQTHLLNHQHPELQQNPQQSPTNAPQQEIEGKQENIAEKGKEEPNEANKAQKIPQDDKFKSQVLDELASLKAEVEQLLQGEAEEKKEEDSEQTNEPGKEE